MSSQGGLKHVATEPARLESKRDRRRGAAGRAAVLRRAPSDSDCSGETASLSADSGDRAVRPAPPPTRSGKTRSRRRGSEWEVLEGLKDGQRFEKRPEVFNGYLHKKRKWPLKGWHKRFFVVDGGILVYARSPTDVARGRLHGSVDVGLSVISAKARRRRIDIDADEFIYHLRAKTPDVFRTWLNVLKAHRLYRQHLLTFGARESVPKIHAPADDLPPTDTSSRTSKSSIESISSIDSRELQSHHIVRNQSALSPSLTNISSTGAKSSHYGNTDPTLIKGWCTLIVDRSELMPLSFESFDRLDDTKYDSQTAVVNSIVKPVTDGEKPIMCTELSNALKNPGPVVKPPLLNECSFDTSYILCENDMICVGNTDNGNIKRKFSSTPAFFFFFRKKKDRSKTPDEFLMKTSRKSTNLVKYKNVLTEPPLKKPLSKCVLLEKSKFRAKNSSFYAPGPCSAAVKAKYNNKVQVKIDKQTRDKASQDKMTADEYDQITERLLVSIFAQKSGSDIEKEDSVKVCINELVQELCDIKIGTTKNLHPVKTLFRCLLQFWLQHTRVKNIRDALKRVKSVHTQSEKFITKDQNLSSVYISNIPKATQFYGINGRDYKHVDKYRTCKKTKKHHVKDQPDTSTRINSDVSEEKERRIQELERLLKNTVYMCETMRVNRNKEIDIKITKKLIDNLTQLSKNSTFTNSKGICRDDASNSSSEVSQLQEAINHLISETSIPPEIAKDFLSAYLDVLQCNSNSAMSDSNETSDCSESTNFIIDYDFQTDSSQKEQLSKSFIHKLQTQSTEIKNSDNDEEQDNKIVSTDPGQIYLIDMLDKVTKIYKKVSKIDSQFWFKNKCKTSTKCEGTEMDSIMKDELGASIKGYSNNKFILENHEENTVVINLSKYELEHISMENNPADNGITSITIKLREKAFDFGEANHTNLSLKFPDDRLKLMSKINERRSWPRHLDTIRSKSTYSIINHSAYDPNDKMYFKTNTNDETITRQVLHESKCSLNFIFNSSKFFRTSFEEFDAQSCFVMSSFKNTGFNNKFQPKKVKTEGSNKKVAHVQINSPNTSTNILVENKYAKSVSLFDKPHPKIIDEKFILLLMENLTLLSKNLPGIYKDINNLYLKLKKKHDKTLKDNNRGLSLLGKIYNDQSQRPTNDLEVQCEGVSLSLIHKEVQYEVDNDFIEKTFMDQSLSAYEVSKHVCDCSEQTEDSRCKSKTVNTVNEKDKDLFTSLNSYDTDREFNYIKGDAFDDCLVCVTSNRTDKKKTHEGINSNKEEISVLNRQQSGKRDRAMNTIYIIGNNFAKVIPVKENNDASEDNANENFTVWPLFVSNNYFVTKTISATASNVRLKNKSEDLNTIYRCTSEPSVISESGGPLENASRELGQAQLSVQQLQRLLDALELQQQVHHDTDVSLEGASPNVKKDRRKFGLRKKKSSTKCASVELAPALHIDPSSSHTALSALTAPPSPGGGASSAPNSAASLPIACAATRPQSLPGAEALGATHSTGGPTSLTSLTPDHQLREDFTVLAKDLLGSLKGIVATLVCERGRLRAAMEAADTTTTGGGPMMAALRTNLTSALQQNSELRSRLSRIHDASDLADISSVGHNGDSVNRQFQQSLSYSSSCVSASEFFDAEEHDEEQENQIIAADEAGVIELDGDSSSEAGSLSSEEGSASSDNSDALSAEPVTLRVANGAEGTEGTGAEGSAGWSRRTRLPCPRPTPGGPSLWNLLYKNIGKDLSQISMPVTINEPLNMLQRLCEELEYSELLDAAATCPSGVERMALISAFAVSAYASSAHRAASKPFNPLLAETYECVRSDRGFRFVAEQVSHHPPISACHAESSRWWFWQEARIKTKFWGKSMEFQPTGRVHVKLLTTGDHYTWNKVTTCVHNLFGGQRWVDQYGDMHITCRGTDITCKLNFIKASSWSSSRHEVRGAVSGPGGARLRLHGRWSEALYAGEPPAARCLWRPGAIPPEHEMYYGFTRFAMELNEIEPSMRDVLPHTDTRLRPDQRALEEGDVESAEHLKHQLEQAQRERRRGSPEHTPAWFRKNNEGSESGAEDEWVFSGDYWSCRDAGFPSPRAPTLW